MKRTQTNAAYVIAFAVVLSILAEERAIAQENQTTVDEKCAGPVYTAKEVTHQVRITHKPEVGFTEEARANGVSGTVSVSAVLCGSGRVIDIQVLRGLPYGMTEIVIGSVRHVTFTPAEKDGHRVSQQARFVHHFNTYGGKFIAPDAQQNRLLVEDLMVEGNRRLRDDEIIKHIRTRHGEVYNAEQVQRDLQALLNLSLFDTTQTRVATERGVRGGVIVIFYVKELPIIRDITFTGLKGVTMEEVLKALCQSDSGICKERPFNPAQVIKAKAVIRKLLAARGWLDATVEVQVDELSQVSVALGFVINARK
jgi:hypothetical protein